MACASACGRRTRADAAEVHPHRRLAADSTSSDACIDGQAQLRKSRVHTAAEVLSSHSRRRAALPPDAASSRASKVRGAEVDSSPAEEHRGHCAVLTVVNRCRNDRHGGTCLRNQFSCDRKNNL